MKALTDFIANLGTGILTIIASSLLLAPHPDVFHLEVSNVVRVIFLSITTLIALSNLTGRPKRIVSHHWEETDFGPAFFPVPENMKNQDRRFLAGMMESLGIALTLTGYPEVRGLGYALLMVMFGRGSLINARIDLGAMILAGGVSFVSGLLLKDELYTVV